MNSDSRSGAGTAADWRAPLLASITLRPVAGRTSNRLAWPDYDGRSALRWGEGMIVGIPAVAAVWDFTVHGGSFGEADAAAFAAAAATALATRRPLVSLLRSGGTRLQEGVAGLVGLPRAALALAALDDAGIGHLAVADQPTTGGVWVTIGSRGDLRCAVAGATVGFAGPRVVEAMTGTPPPADSHRAASAFAAGLVDAMPSPNAVADWLRRALTALAPPAPPALSASPASPASEQPVRPNDPAPSGDPAAPSRPTGRAGAARTGWEQVRAARTATRPDGAELLQRLLPDAVDLVGADGGIAARVGALRGAGRTAVVVAVGARRGGAPGPDGYRLLIRAARLAGKLGAGLVTLVDTPGAAADAAAEAGGIAAAIGDAMAAVVACPAPTVAIVHGEGGSGGALAAAVTDVVAMTPDSYFTALSPEGAAATLRIPASRAADGAGLRPADLYRLGFADQLLAGGDPDTIAEAVVTLLDDLRGQDPDTRRRHRWGRWSTELRNSL